MAPKMVPLSILLLLGLTYVVSGSKELQDFYSQITELLNEAAGSEDLVPLKVQQVPGWPQTPPNIGQITGVAINHKHQPVIFHRGPRVWEENSFNESHHYQHISEGPIPVSTLVTLDASSGEVVSSWGSNMFYMPHGLTIDKFGYYYVTDVALHQVFKLRPGLKHPLLEFGVRFQPGSGLPFLCQPTDIAVASTGEIFISDGYCNSRVLMFTKYGNLLNIIPQSQQFLSLRVPHSLTLLEDEDLLCIADRDNMRVVCPRAGLDGSVPDPRAVLTIQQPDLGLVYAVASNRGRVYAVNGPTIANIPVRGFTMDPIAEKVLDQWAPKEGFQSPHDLDICHNTSALYVTEIGPNRIWKFQLAHVGGH